MSSPDKNGVVQPPEKGGVCCRHCEAAALAHLGAVERMLHRTFIVCTTCGNKRCPRATNHDLACTDSNAAGQPGSYYE